MPEVSLFLYGAAFVAGFLMFLAPCTLPLVPAYLAFVAGVHDPRAPGAKKTLLVHAVAFVVGFSLVFTFFGVAAGFFGFLLVSIRNVLTFIGAVLIISFGLLLLFGNRLPFFGGSSLPVPKFLSLGQPSSAFLIGTLFALGWTPCVGPVLASVLLLASTKATALTGGLLLLVFSLGLAIPFLLVALLYEAAAARLTRFARITQIVNYCGALFLIILGILLLLGEFGTMVSWGLYLLHLLQLDGFTSYF